MENWPLQLQENDGCERHRHYQLLIKVKNSGDTENFDARHGADMNGTAALSAA
jgi:hypothetical protein